MFQQNYPTIKSKLDSFTHKDGSINATLVQEEWFPTIDADIFISHAHEETELALGLSGWLHGTFGLTCFIDSTVWGYGNDLLKEIDKDFCRIEGTDSFDYNKRNYSTSHVHMMLAVALQKMTDHTECLFFLKPAVSRLSTEDLIEKTESPWIYAEIAASRMIRKREPQDHLMSGTRMFSLLEAVATFTYDLETDHLIRLFDADFVEWQKKRRGREFGLTALYRLKKSAKE